MRIVSIANQKGGCGKTTTAMNLAACLAARNRQVLLMDLDPQGHSTLGLNTRASGKTLFDALFNGNGGEPAALDEITVPCGGFDLAPSNIHLSLFEQHLSMVPGRESRLKTALEALGREYDYVLIDCPPSLGLLTFNALVASKEVFIPVDMGFFSLQGTTKLLEIIDLVSQKTGNELRAKALAVMVDLRTRISREILENLKENFKSELYDTPVRFNVRLKEAASYGKTILTYDPKCSGARDYGRLAEEILQEEEKEKPVLSSSVWKKTSPETLETRISRFVFHAPNAKSVRLAGSFNNWAPTDDFLMDRDPNGVWVKIVSLPPGEYQYKFFVDESRWVEDTLNSDVSASNPFGSKNSIRVVH